MDAAWVVLGRTPSGVAAVVLDAEGARIERIALTHAELPEWIAATEREAGPRWV